MSNSWAFWRKLRRRDEDLAEEIRAHLSMAAQDRVARGESLDDATRAARREFGNELLIKEVTRDMWGWTLLEQFVQDLRFALRGMINNRVFTLLMTLSLALGIGANTAIFSLIDAILWRLLPVKDPAGLWVVGDGVTYRQYRTMRENSRVADLAAYSAVRLNVSVDGSIEPTADGQLVSGVYFSLLGVKPVIGRSIGGRRSRSERPSRRDDRLRILEASVRVGGVDSRQDDFHFRGAVHHNRRDVIAARTRPIITVILCDNEARRCSQGVHFAATFTFDDPQFTAALPPRSHRYFQSLIGI